MTGDVKPLSGEECRQCHGTGLRTVVRGCTCPAGRGLPSELTSTRLKAAEERADALRAALMEIASPPDASKGKDYGCLDIHEAREIAEQTLADDFGWYLSPAADDAPST